MTDEAKEKIYQQIINGDVDDGPEQKTPRKGKKAVRSGWKMGVAACLAAALIIPTGVYAAGKLSEYMNVSIEKNNYQAEIKLHKSKNTPNASETASVKPENNDMKYIQVNADFGSDYKFDKETSFDEMGVYSYSHKDGYDAGKDFYYELLYMDESSDAILNLYDQSSIEEMEINGHKALFCVSNLVQGSRYSSDYDTEYTLNMYVFYDEYGYIINYCGMQGLGKNQIISLAKKTAITETSKKDANGYTLLSEFAKADTEKMEEPDVQEVTLPVKEQNDLVKHHGITYQVCDVKISDYMTDYDTTDPKQELFLDQCRDIWDKNGKLKPYVRENIKYGDGISEAEKTVTGEETIQPKMVYVTMKVSGVGTFQLPSMEFFEKKGQKYYDTQKYWQYNRPENIEFALVDFEPCYFKETVGGKQYMIKNLKTGEEQTFHFAYIIDGDMTDSMYLCLEDGYYPYNGPYIDISQ